MERVELKFCYTWEEHVKAYRKYILKSKKSTQLNVVIVCVYFIFSLIYFFLSNFDTFSVMCLVVATLAVIVCLVIYFYVPVRIFKQTKKFLEEYDLTFSDEGIIFKTNDINSELNWELYEKVLESREFYYMLYGTTYTLLPKRVFKDSKSQELYRDLVTENLGPIEKLS